jgi:hypothetical protein
MVGKEKVGAVVPGGRSFGSSAQAISTEQHTSKIPTMNFLFMGSSLDVRYCRGGS